MLAPLDAGWMQPAINVDAALTRAEEFLNTIEATVAGSSSVRVSADALSPEHFHYFAVREQIQRIDRLIQQIDHSLSPPADPIAARRASSPAPTSPDRSRCRERGGNQ